MEQKEWKRIVENFRDHFRSSGVTEDESKIMFESGTSRFSVNKDGEIRGEMPLHSMRLDSFDSINFEDGKVGVKSRDARYVFRK